MCIWWEKARFLWITNALYSKPPNVLFLHNQRSTATSYKVKLNNWSEKHKLKETMPYFKFIIS